MKLLLAAFFSMTLFTSCIDPAKGSVQYDFANAVNLRDVSYGKDSANKMDIYLPANRSVELTKSIILIHGGGWNAGNKSDLNTYIDSFKRRMPDYAIFNINYRLAGNGNLFPTQENDVKAAVEFVTGKSKEYGINNNKIVLLGASAGAHLALLQAYKYTTPPIAAVIDFFGPTDLETMYHKPWHPLVPVALQMITGTTPEQNRNIYRQSSPVNFISKTSSPTLIFHGARDQVVSVAQSRLLKQSLEKANVPAELVIYPMERHGWQGTKMTDSFDKIQAFLNRYVQ